MGTDTKFDRRNALLTRTEAKSDRNGPVIEEQEVGRLETDVRSEQAANDGMGWRFKAGNL